MHHVNHASPVVEDVVEVEKGSFFVWRNHQICGEVDLFLQYCTTITTCSRNYDLWKLHWIHVYKVQHS